jgi:hypothetical protein
MKTTQFKQTNPTTVQSFASACFASCQKLAAQVDRVRESFLAEFRDTFASNGQLLNHVINEADALAWQTDYPQLFFPTLALEKVQAAASWKARQEQLFRRAPAYALAF